MSQTMIEKILSAHAERAVKPGEIADVFLDTRAARDFGGANVVNNLESHDLGVADPARTVFTFDCNPTGSDQKYAANQHLCRLFARKHGIRVYDIDSGIGTHVALDNGLVWPGSTFVSTDSHANILGAVGAFGQGLGTWIWRPPGPTGPSGSRCRPRFASSSRARRLPTPRPRTWS